MNKHAESPVCRVEDLDREPVFCARQGKDARVAVTRLDDETYVAFETRCPHKQGPISKGRIKDGVLTCPWHGFRFDLRTGKTVGYDGILRLQTFQVSVRDGEIFVSP